MTGQRPVDSKSARELSFKCLLELKAVEEAFKVIIQEQKTGRAFNFKFALEAMSKLGLTIDAMGYPPLMEISNEFEALIRLEGLRAGMALRPVDRTGQLIPFFFAFCRRLRLTLEAFAENPMPASAAIVNDFRARKRRVLVVDDSKTFQLLLRKICQTHPEMEVVGVAGDAVEAEKLIEKLHPDVITLDVHMPGMDGFTFLSHLKKKYPIAVVLISSIKTESQGDIITGGDVFNALYQGALDFIHKSFIVPTEAACSMIANRVYKASLCRLSSLMRFYADAPSSLEEVVLDVGKVVAIGVSTGGTRTLIDILRQLPRSIPPVLICQQIVPGFSKLLIQQLNEVYPFVVKEAEQNEAIEPMKVLVAPEGFHMSVAYFDGHYRIQLSDGDSTRFRPSIDILFDSVAMCFESKAVGVLLPGSTLDGAQGLLEIRKAGGYTIVEDESDSPDPTLTREAVRIDAAMVSAWGDHVAEVLLDALVVGTPKLPQQKAPSKTLLEGEGPKILIVDDSPTIRALVRYHLRALGLSNFSEAKTGLSAWQMITSAFNENAPYELVISDQNMPEMLGLELLQKIRAHEKLKSLPFILVTTMTDRESVMKAIHGGINDFVTKPMSANALAEKVRTLLRIPSSPAPSSVGPAAHG